MYKCASVVGKSDGEYENRIINNKKHVGNFKRIFSDIQPGMVVKVKETDVLNHKIKHTNNAIVTQKTDSVLYLKYVDKPYRTSVHLNDLISRNVTVDIVSCNDVQ